MKTNYGFTRMLTKELKGFLKNGVIQITPDTEDANMVYVLTDTFVLHITIETYNQYVLPVVLLPAGNIIRLSEGKRLEEGMSIENLRQLFQHEWQAANDLGVQIDCKDTPVRLIGNTSNVTGVNVKYYSMLNDVLDIKIYGKYNPILFFLPMNQKVLIAPFILFEFRKIVEAIRKAYFSDAKGDDDAEGDTVNT